MQTKPYLNTDFYKISHCKDVLKGDSYVPALHPEGIEMISETLTPRQNSYFKYDDKMVVFGYEFFVHNLVKDWNKEFFSKPWKEIEKNIQVYSEMNPDVYDSMKNKLKDLHKLGYLPIKIMALPEGSLVPMRVPALTIRNTDPRFYWLPGFLETTLLSNTFVTTGVASVARQFRKIGQHYADLSTDDDAYLDYQFHDFSQRGQHGDQACVLGGIGHLSSFKGSDAIPAVAALMDMYPEEDTNFGKSVVATEHSIMESLGGKYGTDISGQLKAWRSLVRRNPKGILSVVADTYSYWDVIDYVLPKLKDEIMKRDGKLVVSPDSLDEYRDGTGQAIKDTAQQLVVSLQALYDTFGGHVNSKGYKVLDSHVGLIHGEGITLDNICPIFEAILDAGFSAENVTFGVGAYVYSVKISRDDFGQALKATDCKIDGKEIEIFKDPHSKKEAFKRSAKGAVSIHGKSGSYHMIEHLTFIEAESDPKNQMHVLYTPEREIYKTPFEEIRRRILSELDK